MATSGCAVMFWAMVTVIVTFDVCMVSSARQVKMRMVEEPINNGANWNTNGEPDGLHAKVKPANFSGPPHLKRLLGRCFSKTINSYKYELCPFQNVTQHEQSLRWNPYSGILGIWQEWNIEGNVFKSLMMKDGDECGQKSRQVTVELACGALNSIANVSEPTTCEYLMIFNTPLVCHRHSLLVYPVLNETLRGRWDAIEGELFNQEITLQGYRKKLTKIFQDSGLLLDSSVKEKLKQSAGAQPAPAGDGFDSLETCSDAFRSLQEEVDRLRAQLSRQGQDDAGNPLFNMDDIYT